MAVGGMGVAVGVAVGVGVDVAVAVGVDVAVGTWDIQVDDAIGVKVFHTFDVQLNGDFSGRYFLQVPNRLELIGLGDLVGLAIIDGFPFRGSIPFAPPQAPVFEVRWNVGDFIYFQRAGGNGLAVAQAREIQVGSWVIRFTATGWDKRYRRRETNLFAQALPSLLSLIHLIAVGSITFKTSSSARKSGHADEAAKPVHVSTDAFL